MAATINFQILTIATELFKVYVLHQNVRIDYGFHAE